MICYINLAVKLIVTSTPKVYFYFLAFNLETVTYSIIPIFYNFTKFYIQRFQMEGSTVDHSDSDSGESWTLLESHPPYGDDAPDFSKNSPSFKR